MIYKIIGLAWLSIITLANAKASDVEKPNVIIFYVDDLGWQDAPLNDLDAPCPYEMPNLKKLAKSGMNFSQAYASAPTCSPSRAGLLTGQHPAKIGMTHVYLGSIATKGRPQPYNPPYLNAHLDRSLLTLGSAMQQNGYKTGHVGKWHVGLSAAEYGFGFVDHTRGVHRGMKDRTTGFPTPSDKKYPLSKQKYPPISEKHPEGISYPYDQVTESALKFMDENKGEPFFLNLWHWMVHWPVLTRNGDLLEHYCDKMNQPFPPKPGDMTLQGQQNPYFGAMVTTVDWSLGRVVDFLEKTDDPRHPGKKLVETTYIIFTSDNGGAEQKGAETISDNYPLKYGKQHTEEGGVRVPMVVAGPGISADSQCDGMVSQLDYFPTILNLTGAKIAPKQQQELSGLDISPVLAGQTQKVTDQNKQERKSLFWHFPHNKMTAMKSAIREGDFKLYKLQTSGKYELYRLYENEKRVDLEEKINLADKPEFAPVVKRLAKNLEASLAKNKAQGPYLNPDYSPKTKPSSAIVKSTFNQTNRKATLKLDPNGPQAHEAYIIYRKKSDTKSNSNHPLGFKLPTVIDARGYSISAEVPAGISAYLFVLIDKNNYQLFSKEMTSEQGKKSSSTSSITKPNILFIMVDDLGKEWISSYGSETIKTPNIDALAAGGLKFNNAYSMPSCTSSRTMLLTGQYPWRNGYVSHWDVPRWGVGYFDWKKKENITFARLMKKQGYATCAAGKWQINDFRLEPQAMKKHGFDDWAMWTGSETGNEPSEYRFIDPYINTPAGSKTYKGKFGSDVYTDCLVNFMTKHKDEPMCLYYPMPLVHRPWVATPDHPDAKTRNEKHVAMVHYVDKMVGKLVKSLDDLGIRERTIIIFTTDNGTTGGRVGFTATRNGVEVPGAKGDLNEAGVCAPFIVNCPGTVAAGVETDILTDFSDMLPTFLEFGGGKAPEDLTIDGTSIASVILGKKQDSKREWIMSLGGGQGKIIDGRVVGAKVFGERVIRDKQYKVWVSEKKKITRLHDLKKDPWEKTNLLDSDLAEHKAAIQKFQAVVDSLPDKDATPFYEPRAANSWDRNLQKKKPRPTRTKNK